MSKKISSRELRALLSEAKRDLLKEATNVDVRDAYDQLYYELKQMYGRRVDSNNILADMILDILRNEVFNSGVLDSKLEDIPYTAGGSHALLWDFIESIGDEEAHDILTSAHMSLRKEKNESRSLTASQLHDMIVEIISPEGDDLPSGPTALDDMPPPRDIDGPDGESPGKTLGNGGKSRMARQQLHHIAEYAVELWNLLDDEDEIPEWCQSKIAIMSDSIGKIKHHLEYKAEKPTVLKLDGE
ncbi:hypothetical protein OAA09_00030 [bacterium]|nr:hypothetical protein [bacterium]